MWGVVPSDRHDWAKLREDIKKYVMVFSLVMIMLKCTCLKNNLQCFVVFFFS